MASLTTKTTIANRALQLLGSQQISTLNDNLPGAKAILRAYDSVLLSELRKNMWSFAIKRVVLPASSTTPAFGVANFYPLPGDFLMIAPADQAMAYSFSGVQLIPYSQASGQYTDWQIENVDGTLCIATNDSAPINLRYVSSNVTEAIFDPCFAEALACALAVNCCEQLTQSGTKLQACAQFYKAAIDEAKKRNAFEKQPAIAPVSSWTTVRY